MGNDVLGYVKISELPKVIQVNDNDVIVVNHNGKTSKILFSDLMSIIDSKVTHDISAITERLTTLEQSVSTLGTTVNNNSSAIENIITASFNLIGIDK